MILSYGAMMSVCEFLNPLETTHLQQLCQWAYRSAICRVQPCFRMRSTFTLQVFDDKAVIVDTENPEAAEWFIDSRFSFDDKCHTVYVRGQHYSLEGGKEVKELRIARFDNVTKPELF